MAKQVDKLGLLKLFTGSAHWMAPEVVNPKRQYNFLADIWSLGCTVLEMATGNAPFGELECHSVLWKVGNGEGPLIPEDIEDDMKDFISKRLKVTVANRPTCDMLLTHPFITGEPMTPGCLERLEIELQELLQGRRAPVSIASLPQLYYERFGKTLQAEGYLTESQRHGKAGYSLTKLLARLKNTITLIDRISNMSYILSEAYLGYDY